MGGSVFSFLLHACNCTGKGERDIERDWELRETREQGGERQVSERERESGGKERERSELRQEKRSEREEVKKEKREGEEGMREKKEEEK